jgi:VCBS repeat-containing protein
MIKQFSFEYGDSVRVNHSLRYMILVFLFVVLSACGGGGGSEPPSEKPQPLTRTLTGGAVKGPLTNADVQVFKLDTSQLDFKAVPAVSSGATDGSAKLSGVALPLPLNPPYIMEVVSNATTVDITTQATPVLPTLQTVVTQEMLNSGQNIYATPLTTLAVELAIANADSSVLPYAGNNDGTATKEEFIAALDVAANVVVSTFGFGMSANIDIFATPPLFDEQVATEEQMNATAAYRAAIESFAAVTGMASQNTGSTQEEIFNGLASDLMDGEINDAAITDAVTQFDAATTQIPNTIPPLTPNDIKQILIDETTTTNDNTTPPEGWTDNPPNIEVPVTNSDLDADGILNVQDNCLLVSNAGQADENTNGIGDVCENTPVAVSDGISVDEGGTVSLLVSGQASVLANDSDADNDSLTAVLVAGPQHANNFGLNSDGTFSYTHDGSETTNDSFTYHANDGANNSPSVAVTINISPIDDPANLTADEASITEDATPNTTSGNVLDNDSDPDTVLSVTNVAAINASGDYGTMNIDSSGAFIYTLDNTNPTVNALNTGDTLTEVFTYIVNNGPSATLTIIIQGATDGIEPSGDLTGVWKTTQQVITQQDLVSGGCANVGLLNFNVPSYLTLTQSGSDLTFLSVNGGTLSGALTTATEFQLSGVSSWPLALSNSVKTITSSATGQVNSDGSLSGMLTNVEAINNVDLCQIEYSYTAEFVYKHSVSAQDYSGMYADEYVDSNGEQESLAYHLEVNQNGIDLQLFPTQDSNAQHTVISNSYDPATGFFQMEYEELENYETGGSHQFHSTITGLFVRAPDDASGSPIVASFSNGYAREYDGPNATGNIIRENYEIGVGYSKRVTTSGFTRSAYLRVASNTNAEGIFMGISHPPVVSLSGHDLYLEVLNSSSTRLCTALYSERFKIVQQLPFPDMATESFSNGMYSFISCNTTDYSDPANPVHTLTDGAAVTLRIMDTGPDGQIDGNDDVQITSMNTTATVAGSFFNGVANVNSFELNGARPSQTLKNGSIDGMVDLLAYVDASEAMPFSWSPVPGAEAYRVRVIDTNGTAFQNIMAVDGQTTSVMLPADTLGEGMTLIQVTAIKHDVNNNAIANALSKFLIVYPGVFGLFNVEWGDVGPFEYQTFQAALVGPLFGPLTECTIVNNPHLACLGGSVNSFNGPNGDNVITLNMQDMSGSLPNQFFDLYLFFDDAANGSSAFDFPTTIPLTDVRVVQPELRIRSIKWSDATLESRVIISNTFGAGPGGPFDQAIFKANDNSNLLVGGVNTGVNSVDMWVDSTDFLNQYKHFIQFPTNDGFAQGNGHYLRWNTDREWGLGLGLLAGSANAAVRYNAVLTSTADAQLKWVFKQDYSGPDPSAYVAPQLSDIIVKFSDTEIVQAGVASNSGTGLIGDPNNPIPVTNPNFTLTWTGSTPPNGLWQLRGKDTATGVEVRTPWMNASDTTLTDNGDGTWSWTESGGVNLNPGQIIRFEIRTRDVDNTVMGAQRIIDRIHLMGP